MSRELTKREKKVVSLAVAGGTDKELVILDAVDELETKFDEKTAEIQQSFKDTVKDLKDSIPDLNKVLLAVRGAKGDTGESIKGDKGNVGEKGEPGADYILTEQDKADIAKTIKVPVVEKVVETIIKEQPIVTNEIKEVAVADDAETIRNKLELLLGEERLDVKYVKGVEELIKKLDAKIEALPKQVPARSSNSTRFYDLSSQTTGALKVFTVPEGLAGVLFSSDFPMVLMEGNGFTLNRTRTQLTMTTDNAPSSGSQLLYQYISQFNTYG